MGSSHQASAWTSVLQVFVEVQYDSIQPNGGIVLANTALTACKKAHQWKHANELCTAAAAQTLRPDVATCSSIISATGQKLWKEAFSWLQTFGFSSLEMNDIIYNSVLSIVPGNLGKWTLSISILENFDSKKLRRDVVSFNTVITTCDRSEKWQLALLVLRHCRDQLVESTVISLGASISACQRCRKWKIALGIIRKSVHSKVSTVVCNSIISACTTAEAWQHASHYIDEPSFRFDQFTMNTLLCASGTSGVPWRCALEKVEQMNLPWDLITYNAAFQVYSHGKWEPCLQLAQELRTCVLEHSITTISGLISSCGHMDWQVSYAVCKNLIAAATLQSNIILCNAMISGCEQNSKWPKTLELQVLSETRGMQLSMVSFGSIVNACEKDKRWKLAMALVDAFGTRKLESLYTQQLFVICYFVLDLMEQ